MSNLRVYTFSPNWGLPAGGPFDLKLLAWLELAGIPYERVSQDDTRKAPKKKNPWVELDGEPIADTEIVIGLLTDKLGVTLDEGLSPQEKAIGHAWRRAMEEHFHQVLEWELFVHPAGAAFVKEMAERGAPPVLGALIYAMMRRHMSRQLYARGVARHAPEVIAAKGIADLEALAAHLEGRDYLVSDRPTSYDAAVFGLLAPMVYWTMETPVAQRARAIPAIKGYCDRMRERCFGAR